MNEPRDFENPPSRIYPPFALSEKNPGEWEKAVAEQLAQQIKGEYTNHGSFSGRYEWIQVGRFNRLSMGIKRI
jgi:hypothetical protein